MLGTVRVETRKRNYASVAGLASQSVQGNVLYLLASTRADFNGH